MFLSRIVVGSLAVGQIIFGADLVFSQDYPNKPVRIVTSGVGGGNDFVARVIAQGIAGDLGQQVIVENRGGVVSGEIVSRSAPDGYTLLVGSVSFWIGPLLRRTSYDPLKDFSPITSLVRSPLIVIVHPSLPVKSVKELIALAKARPGELNFSTGGTGSGTHLALELFKAMTGVNVVRIPYKDGASESADLIGGQVQATFGSAGEMMPHVKSGKLRALAVTSAEPTVLVPGLPTVTASGVPGYESVQLYGMFAPAKTPDAIIKRLNQEVLRFLRTAAAKERFWSTGVEAVGSSPEQFEATVKSEIARMGKVIRDAGIKAD